MPLPIEAPLRPTSILSPFDECVNPFIGGLLRSAHLDKRFVRGDGCRLWDSEGREYLDFVGAYGALPFGFHPPEILEAVEQFCRSQEPSFVQPSMLTAAGELARRLIELAPPGLRFVTFTNSGAESIEAAIKLARSATGKPGILSTHGGFHGKTLGALSASGRPVYQASFGAPVPGFFHVPYGDVDALNGFLERHAGTIAAFVVEPIQGEGGIVVPPPGYLASAGEICRRRGVLIICDEVQTGLGRTGSLFACSHEGLQPDILTLAKALGGGVVPIGAMLATGECFNEEFALKHTSTFAGNALSCRVGLRSLELLTRDNERLIRHVAETGDYLRQALEGLRDRFPNLVRSVRGRGFLLGLELTSSVRSFGRQCLMGSMAEQGSLVLGIASYLLNVNHIRVAPTLFASRVMRIEPPLVADREVLSSLLRSLEEVFEILDTCDTARFFGHFVDFPVADPVAPPTPLMRRPQAAPQAVTADERFGFIVHPFDVDGYVYMDEALAAYDRDQLQTLMDRLSGCHFPDIEETLVLGESTVRSPLGRTRYGEFVVIAETAQELRDLPRADALRKVRDAVSFVSRRGALLVGLGGFTSIVTRNGSDLLDLGVPLTTGNGYTVVSAWHVIEESITQLRRDPWQTRVAVVGASGSIGRALAMLLAERVGSLTLIARPGRIGLKRLRQVAHDVLAHLAARARLASSLPAGSMMEFLASRGLMESAADPETRERALIGLEEDGRLILTGDLRHSLADADIIATATSSVTRIVTSDALRPGAVVCEISRPFNVSQDVRESRRDVLIIDGGLVLMPGRQSLGVGVGLPEGMAYACMAETMVMSLEGHLRHGSIGSDLSLSRILELEEQACRHGFEPAPLMTSGRRIGPGDWARVLACRNAPDTLAGLDSVG
jgi:acetylornithine/succinyldiaminopimelate/putrescine aminotransferase/predicted amino acid dehydrogenase